MNSPRFSYISFVAAFLAAMPPLYADLLVKPKDVLLVATETPMMQGMVSVDIAKYFLMCQPVEGLKVVQSSDSQEEVEFFMKRIDKDVAFWHPTLALISHGVNDGRTDAHSDNYTHWHPLYLGMTIDKLKAIGVRTIVLASAQCVDSFYFQKNPDEARTHNANLAAFRDKDRQIAEKAGVRFADMFAPMFDVMARAKSANGEKYVFGGDDGRYPNRNAQLVMAYVFLKALGCDGAIGTITVDMGLNSATGTAGQKILSMQGGVVQVESSRYPYCFRGEPQVPDSTTGIISFFPFNEELNRYLLVVKGLTGAKAKVTWGAESREFSVANLEKGVNLAAAFAAHTPFDSQFMRIEDTLWQQQLKQWVYTDTIVHYLEEYRQMAPGGPFDQLVSGIYEQNDKNGAAAASLFVPIQHTLRIEALP